MWRATIMVMVKHRGFTIVELMVVIVIVAILMSIVTVAYNGVQARSRDAIRKNDIASLAKQIQIYALQKGTWSAACGDTTNTMSGYTNVTYGANPTITSCLKTFDDTNKQLNDPSKCVSMAADFATDQSASCITNIRSAYKAYNTGLHYYLATKLESQTTQLTNYTDPDIGALKTTMINTGFNYVLKVR